MLGHADMPAGELDETATGVLGEEPRGAVQELAAEVGAGGEGEAGGAAGERGEVGDVGGG